MGSAPSRHFAIPAIVMVTDRRQFGVGEQAAARLEAVVTRAARAGVDWVQVRERDLADRQLFALVRRLQIAVRDTAAKILVNGRPDVALAAGVRGVHLRGASPPASRVRTIVPDWWVIGRSVHSREEARAAAEDGGCDYLLFGTVFPSVNKPTTHATAGAIALREVCAAVGLPVLAIGGVDETRAGEIAAAGAAGFAAIGMFAVEHDERRLQEMIARARAPFGEHHGS